MLLYNAFQSALGLVDVGGTANARQPVKKHCSNKASLSIFIRNRGFGVFEVSWLFSKTLTSRTSRHSPW